MEVPVQPSKLQFHSSRNLVMKHSLVGFWLLLVLFVWGFLKGNLLL